jgi:hypothetical protein
MERRRKSGGGGATLHANQEVSGYYATWDQTVDLLGNDTDPATTPFDWKNDGVEVNAAPGVRMHTHPASGSARNVAAPILDMLYPPGEPSTIPVIAVTAFAMKGDEEKIREGGCEAYISKPISVLSFLQTIDGFLKNAS